VIELLLAIIAACLLFGGAAVLGFLEAAFWLLLFLAVVLIVGFVVRLVVKGAIGDGGAGLDSHPPDISKVVLAEWDDWIAQSRRQRVENSLRQLHARDIASDVEKLVRRLRAPSVLSLSKGELAEGSKGRCRRRSPR
jgi:hypothetical protein